MWTGKGRGEWCKMVGVDRDSWQTYVEVLPPECGIQTEPHPVD